VIESDVIVIGAGVMGASTARTLAARGLTVNLIEQFTVGHNRGSSHGTSRIFRLSYPEARYVEMAQESLLLWRAAEEETGESLLLNTGGLDIGEGIDANAAALETCDADFEYIKGVDANERWPQLRFENEELVLFQPDAGIVLADRAVDAFVRSAVSNGARLHTQCRIESIDEGGDGVQAHSEKETFLASVAIVTAGAWARDLLKFADIALDVRPTRETVSYFAIDEMPPTFVEWRDPLIYALPAPGHGLKAGEHIAGPTTDPCDEGEVSAESIERVSAWVARRFPRADPTPAHAETCIYTNTPDEHFVLERHGQIVVGSACSGHGFKFAPLIGKRLADLAAD
jgi:sarcosine oxidase